MVFPLKLEAAVLLYEKGTHITVRPRTTELMFCMLQNRNTFYVHSKKCFLEQIGQTQ